MSSKSPHWMPLNIDDYLRDTRHLNTVQHGAYLLLIFHCWQHGRLPLGAAERAAIVNRPLAEWEAIRGPVDAFFDADGYNKRVSSELAKAESLVMKRRFAAHLGGKKSGEIRRAKMTIEASASLSAKRRRHPIGRVAKQVLQSIEREASASILRQDGDEAFAKPIVFKLCTPIDIIEETANYNSNNKKNTLGESSGEIIDSESSIDSERQPNKESVKKESAMIEAIASAFNEAETPLPNLTHVKIWEEAEYPISVVLGVIKAAWRQGVTITDLARLDESLKRTHDSLKARKLPSPASQRPLGLSKTTVGEIKEAPRPQTAGNGQNAPAASVLSTTPKITQANWDDRVASFQDHAYWRPREWGPTPLEKGCRAPPEILKGYGF